MILLDIKDKKLYSRAFIQKVVNLILPRRLFELVDYKKLINIESLLLLLYDCPTLNLLDTCLLAIKNSIILEGNDNYVVIINPDAKYKNINVENIIKTMTYGNLDLINGYPLFIDIRNRVLFEIPDLLENEKAFGIMI